jgi:hypothetical protein
MRNAWIASVARMPPDEMQTLMKGLYPRVLEARCRKAEHEALTGHSVHVHGWRRVFGRAAFGGWPPGTSSPNCVMIGCEREAKGNHASR